MFAHRAAFGDPDAIPVVAGDDVPFAVHVAANGVVLSAIGDAHFTTLLVGVILWVWGEPGGSIAAGVARAVGDGVVVGLTVSVAICTAMGVEVGALGGPGSVTLGATLIVAVGVGVGMAGRGPVYSLARQVGSVVIGILVGSAGLLIAYVATTSETYVELIRRWFAQSQ